jgi:hypothetical protein
LVKYLNANSSQDIFDTLSRVIAPSAAKVTNVKSLYALETVKGTILDRLYLPATWPALAKQIVTLLNQTAETTTGTNNTQSNSNETAQWIYGDAVSAIYGIRGSDTTFKPTSAEEYLPTIEYETNLSGFSDSWYPPLWASARWKIPARERFYGNFTAKTKHPIMFLNGDADPVTPLQAARTASKGFEGSVVLAHGGFGHASMSDPSSCVQKYTRAYFMNGTLPAEQAYCKPDLGPWQLAKARNALAYGPIESSNGTLMDSVNL